MTQTDPLASGPSTSEGKWTAYLASAITTGTAIFLVLAGTGAIHPRTEIAAAVPGVAAIVTAWIVRGFQDSRATVKAAALNSGAVTNGDSGNAKESNS